ncbi:MAG: CC0125/CC1285 family lipoprotein [Alphaproteobacteria bacterium]
MRSANKVFLAGMFACLFLASCTSPTPYQASGIRGGYSEEQLERDVYRIEADGNMYTSPERLKNILLVRASELSIQNNYKGFLITGGEGVKNIRLKSVVPGHSYQVGNAYASTSPYGASISGTSNTVIMPPVERESQPMPVGNILIKMTNNPTKGGSYYDAKSTYERLLPYLQK